MISKNNEYITPSDEEHNKIVNFLIFKDFHKYIINESIDASKRDYIIRLCGILLDQNKTSYKKTQNVIAERLGEADHSKVSNCLDVINQALESFSLDKDINPPIQLFFWHLNDKEEKKLLHCHLACAETKFIEHLTKKGVRKKRYSLNLVPLEKASSCFSPKEIFLNRLEYEAKKQLDLKLSPKDHNDYIELRLEIGKCEDSSEKGSSLDYGRYDHNRDWSDYDIDAYKDNPEGSYILSSETGSGKTTFLRYLQLEIIRGQRYIPIFIKANEVKQFDLGNSNRDNFLSGVARLFNGYLENRNVKDFLIKYQNEIIFLIDGLDQITGANVSHEELATKIKGMLRNHTILSSRPFAVLEQEKDREWKFLRLKPYDENGKKKYFADKYNRAKVICKNCPETLSVPMLAYMVRDLIENDQDKKIMTRKDLYERYVYYIFEQYKHDNIGKSVAKPELARRTLRRISFHAIANEKEHFLQAVPFSTLTDKDLREIDEMLKYGVFQIIINRANSAEKCLYFSHQSFQEYLAAEYISQYGNEHLFDKVIAEKWNPKWKEVLRFLMGFKGQITIERILNEKDNPFYSKLFLAAELLSEIKVSLKLKNDITCKLEELLKNTIFFKNAFRHLSYVNEEKAITICFDILESEEWHTKDMLLRNLCSINDSVVIIFKKVIEGRLEDINRYVRCLAVKLLGSLPYTGWIDINTLEKIISKLEDKNYNVIASALSAISDLQKRRKLSSNHIVDVIEKIRKKLKDENGEVRRSAVMCLERFLDPDDLDSNDFIIEDIVDMIEDINSNVQEAATVAIWGLKCVNIKIIEKIIDKLENKCVIVQFWALSILSNSN